MSETELNQASPRVDGNLAHLAHLPQKQAYSLEDHLMLKDRWYAEEDLGMRFNKHQGIKTISFERIIQPWLKPVVKRFILFSLTQGKSFRTLINYISSLNKFSEFLNERFVQSFEEINDELLDLYYQKLSPQANYTIRSKLCDLHTFLKTGKINGWFQVKTYWFKGKAPRNKPDSIKYIPEDVLRQMDEHLHHLPEQLQRLVILFRTLGLRAGELLQMRFDCLRQRKDGQWELHFTNWKFNEDEDVLPIIAEIAEVIRAQQTYIRTNLGEEFEYLFAGQIKTQIGTNTPPLVNPKVMSLSLFNRNLNKLAEKYQILDSSGNVWKFTSHQFRRTLATRMTNEGIRQYIIQRVLRHQSPEMMQHYAEVFQNTFKKEFAEFSQKKKIVDVTGAEVGIDHPELENDVGLNWLRSRMQPGALAMGFCARPQLLKPCPHANACMSCQHFRLDSDDLPALKQHLERTEILKAESEKRGFVRQQQGIEEDREKLIKLIKSLEENDGFKS
jgi:integrase